MSNFNPDEFLMSESEETLATKFIPWPEGECEVFVQDVKADKVGQNNRPVLKVIFSTQAQEIKDHLSMDEPKLNHTVWLDIDEETGRLAAGTNKNIGLGRLREALGQNNGSAWAPSHMIGQPCVISVGHDPDKNDPETVYARVTAITAA